MADFSIPGVNSQYDKLVEALMKAERVPRDKEAVSLDKFKSQLSYWQILNQLATQVKDVARSFYSFSNPFREHIASSSNELSFTATATRDAKEQTAKISVTQIATADSFLSDEMPKDMKVEAGHYVFRVGDKCLDFEWKGGGYKSFMQAINRRAKDFLSVSEIKTGPKSTSLLFSSTLLGEKNRLTFEEDALKWAEKIGLIKKGNVAKELFEYSNIKMQPFSSDELPLPLLEKTKNVEYLEITFSFSTREKNEALVAGNTTSSLSSNAIEGNKSGDQKTGEARADNTEKDGDDRANFETVGSVAYEGIIVNNNPSDYTGATQKENGEEFSNEEANKMDESNEDEKNERAIDGVEKVDESENRGGSVSSVGVVASSKSGVDAKNLNIFSIKKENGELVALETAQSTDEKQVIRLAIGGDEKISSLLLNNENALFLNIDSIKLATKSLENEYEPSHPATKAQDAIVLYQGIKMRRSTNNIDDIVPSLTLELHAPSDKTETLKVESNVELIKDSIIEFIGKYNRLIAEINILTSDKPEIIEELSYLTEDEKELARKKLGAFYGDSSLSTLKNNLRTRMMGSYDATGDLPIKILAQFGISSNSTSSSSLDVSRLRGYLEIDEKLLEKTIKEDVEGIRDFFGFDSDGDVIIDSGLAYSIYEYLNPYTKRGGIFFARMNGVEDKIKASEKRLVTYDQKLLQKEAELKRKYGAMEGTLQNLKKQSDSISNFNKAYEK